MRREWNRYAGTAYQRKGTWGLQSYAVDVEDFKALVAQMCDMCHHNVPALAPAGMVERGRNFQRLRQYLVRLIVDKSRSVIQAFRWRSCSG